MELAEPALVLQNAEYYPEDEDGLFTRVFLPQCILEDSLLFPGSIGNDVDVYGDCGGPSITWTLTGPGNLAIHQYDVFFDDAGELVTGFKLYSTQKLDFPNVRN